MEKVSPMRALPGVRTGILLQELGLLLQQGITGNDSVMLR